MSEQRKVEPSRQGRDLIDAFQKADEAYDRAVAEVRRAAKERANASDALSKWLLPSDAQPGETFAIWSRDRHDQECLITVSTVDDGHGHVGIRYRK